MLHTTDPVIKHKTGLLNLAEELSNVSKACKIMGVSRDIVTANWPIKAVWMR
ncbi:TPA: helix-turn-helix domain-containing protein [Escherichia coli]|nr:helix-turn-helix domain-containing protein [Escherichia coli]